MIRTATFYLQAGDTERRLRLPFDCPQTVMARLLLRAIEAADGPSDLVDHLLACSCAEEITRPEFDAHQFRYQLRLFPVNELQLTCWRKADGGGWEVHAGPMALLTWLLGLIEVPSAIPAWLQGARPAVPARSSPT